MINIEWETPQDFFDTLDREFNFTLDACANNENKKCQDYIPPEIDSLKSEWKGIIWLNPPYTKEIYKWIKKAYESSQDGNTVVVLMQGRSSDTKGWHDYIMKASEIRYIKGRLAFGLHGKTYNAPHMSCIIIVFRPYCKGPPSTCSINIKGETL